MLMLMITTNMKKNLNPFMLSITILLISLMAAPLLFKSTMNSWLSFITVMTFSSGMMILFMYTASLTPNEKNKMKKSKKKWILLLMMITIPNISQWKMMESMKTFSNKMTMIVMATLLILVMLAISSHSQHPSQTLNSSF